MPQPYLHDELIAMLQSQGNRWMSLDELAREVNARGNYEKGDGSPSVYLELWHVLPSSNQTPEVRVTDMQVAVAQGIKGRHWLTDRDLWEELAGRLTGRRRPRLTVVHGNERG